MEDSYPEGAIKINAGSGKCNWSGWLNVDVDGEVKGDVRCLPFPDNHADVIVSVHVIEHIHRWEVDDMLKNWFSVLKPDGKLIIECPCMDKVFAYISKCYTEKLPFSPSFSWFPLWGDPKYKTDAMVHKWGYTYLMLKELLIKTGFSNIQYESPRYHFPERDMRITAVKSLTA